MKSLFQSHEDLFKFRDIINAYLPIFYFYSLLFRQEYLCLYQIPKKKVKLQNKQYDSETMYDENSVTPEFVENLEKPAEKFLCPLEANIYDIEFVYFKIRDVTDNQTLFEVRKPQEAIGKPITEKMRTIRYHFGPGFFQLKHIGTTLEFKVGAKAVKNFTMIERHYFKNELIKSYKFEAPFCMPGSTNSMEAVYELPPLPQEKIQDMISSPWETVSDSFYFVEDKLVMHTKALYNYEPFDE